MNETAVEVAAAEVEPKPAPSLRGVLQKMVNQRQEFQYPVGLVSEIGLGQITSHLYYHVKHPEGTIPFRSTFWKGVVEQVGMEWVNKSGTWPKRFMKVAKKAIMEHRGETTSTYAKSLLTQPILSEVGSIASRNTEHNAHYSFDIVDHVDWHAGDFGDDGSCFWGANEKAKEMMSDANFLALRFFDPEDETQGIARCWIGWTPLTHDPVLFNGYGIELLRQVRVLATFLGVAYNKVHLTNNSSDAGTLYINGTRGFILGKLDVEQVDFKLKDEQTECCVNCGDVFDQSNMRDMNGDWWCESCYDEHFTCCDGCGDTLDVDNAHYNSNGTAFCRRCFNLYYVKCEHCEEPIRREDVLSDSSGNEFCSTCYEDHVSTCDDCEDTFYDNDTKVKAWEDLDGNTRYLCPGCLAHAELLEDREIERMKLEAETESETEENEGLADANLKENSNESSKETEEAGVAGGEGGYVHTDTSGLPRPIEASVLSGPV